MNVHIKTRTQTCSHVQANLRHRNFLIGKEQCCHLLVVNGTEKENNFFSLSLIFNTNNDPFLNDYNFNHSVVTTLALLSMSMTCNVVVIGTI